jgi:hypothetical protein
LLLRAERLSLSRRIVFGLATVIALTAGCTAELSPGATVVQASSVTRDARSARVSYSATFDVAAAPEPGPISMTGEGQFDYASRRGRMIFDLTEVLRPSGEVPEGVGEVEMIFAESVLYMKMPFLTRLLPDPKPWIKVDLEAAREGEANVGQLAQLGQSDPTHILELLGGATRSVDDLGTESVRGTKTTHYRTVLDLVRAARDASGAAQPSVYGLMQRTGARELPADVWIDRKGRMRKMSYRVELTPPAGTAAPPSDPDTMSVAMELYEFGIEVRAAPPPDGDVVDLVELSQQQAGP